jgi:methionyl-tRNA synthetase
MATSTYVTTTIPYVNARPHIGFAFELVQADIIARYHRLVDGDVRLQTGTDENALKNVKAAAAAGVPTAEFVAGHAAAFRALAGALDIGADRFIRTTESAHCRGVARFWQRLRREDLYLQDYSGRYCVACEDFLAAPATRCPVHDAPLAAVAERNYFFRLSRYQPDLEALVASGRLEIVPAQRRREVLAFVRAGLRDISISRPSARAAGWGITVPGDDGQTVYVWLDALVNYLSGQGFGGGAGPCPYWRAGTRKIHVIGKDVWKFHAVYWPAFLLSAGLPLPDTIVVHGFLTVDGEKISKTAGNAADPSACITRYGADAVRYYLARALPPFQDADFSTARLAATYKTDLAGGLGNLLCRLTALCARADYGAFDGDPLPPAPDGYHDALRSYRFDRALAVLWAEIAGINQEIQAQRPWEDLRENRPVAVRPDLTRWLHRLSAIGYWLHPFLPATAAQVQQALRGNPIAAAAPLFPPAAEASPAANGGG